MLFKLDVFASQIIENMTKPCYICDINGKVVYANKSAHTILEYSQNDFLALSIFQLEPIISSISEWRQLVQKIQKEEPSSTRSICETKSGKSYNIRVLSNIIAIDEKQFIVRILDSLDNILEFDQKEFFALFNAGPVIIFRWRNNNLWTVEYVSNNVKDILGYEAVDFYSNENLFTHIIHPKELSRVAEEVESCAKSSADHLIHKPYRLRTNEGKYKWFYDFSKIIRDENNNITHYLGYMIEISTVKTEEFQELSKQKQKLDLMMNTAPIAISIISKNLIYEAANKFLLDSLEIKEEEFVGTKVGTLDRNPNFVHFINEVFTATQSPYQREMEVSPGGIKRWFHLVGALMPNKEEAIIVGVDITESKKKDEMLVFQSRQAAMGEMIAHIAHQWRHPIASIGQIVENISLAAEDNKLSDKYLDEKLEKINHQIEYMSRTIDDFKNFFSPSRNKTEFCAAKEVARSVSLLQAMLIDKNIKLEIDIDEQSRYLVYGHPNEFSQVVLNIIQNAKDALLQNLTFNPIIKITINRQEDLVVIKIKDNGGGITTENLPKIFNPYFSTKDISIGTGIGLYMSKIIIEKHMGGILEAHNIEGGACFKIVLNIYKDDL